MLQMGVSSIVWSKRREQLGHDFFFAHFSLHCVMADELFLLSARKLGGSITSQPKPTLKTTVNQFRPSHIFPTSLRSMLVLFTNVFLYFRRGCFSGFFPTEFESICFLPYGNYMCDSSYISHS